jgi:hypothetical protein
MRAFFGRHDLYLSGTTIKNLRFDQFERQLQSIRNMKVCELFSRILSDSAHNPLIVEKYLIVDSCGGPSRDDLDEILPGFGKMAGHNRHFILSIA